LTDIVYNFEGSRTSDGHHELSAAAELSLCPYHLWETQEAMQASGPARAASSATVKQHFGGAAAAHGGFAFQGNVYGNINVPG